MWKIFFVPNKLSLANNLPDIRPSVVTPMFVFFAKKTVGICWQKYLDD